MKKRIYTTPQLSNINIDREISLRLNTGLELEPEDVSTGEGDNYDETDG